MTASEEVQRWLDEIKDAKKRERDFRKDGERVLKIYGAALTIRGGGGYFDSLSKDGVVRAGSEVVRVMNFDFPVDTAKVAANAGDRHYNTNVASGSLKVGPCIYSGAAWKSLLNIA